MLRLVSITSQTATEVRFQTEEIDIADSMPYVMYDTSTGATYSLGMTEDYYGWRAKTVLTSAGAIDTYFDINNTNLYPGTSTAPGSYAVLRPSLFKIMTYQEYIIVQNVITRLDLVRRRYPNPGFSVNTTNSVGQDGTVSFAGGYEKKLTIGEIGNMMEAAIVEINATSPMTTFWPRYAQESADKFKNPYNAVSGMPYDMIEVATLATLIRCLMALGILEVDLSFTASDSGLQITFDRVGHIKGWHDALLTQYNELKLQFKMNWACHSGVAVGTLPYASVGLWGTLLNSAMSGGSLAYSTLGGIGGRGNVPL